MPENKPAAVGPVVVRLMIANDALLEAPIFDKHPRGANWLAVIDIERTLPGGLSRRWMERGKGDCLYGTVQLGVFDPVEFGADYTTTTGKKSRDRWYGVILAKTDSYLLIEKCANGALAVVRSLQARASREDRLRSLEEEQKELVSRAARVEGEIKEIAKEILKPPVSVEAPQEM